MKEQLLITFKATDFIGLLDENYFEFVKNHGRAFLVDLISTAICWQLDFDNEEHVKYFEDSVLLICGYRTKTTEVSEEIDKHDRAIIEFVKSRVKELDYLIPDALDLDYRNRKVYLDDETNTVYLVVEYYCA